MSLARSENNAPPPTLPATIEAVGFRVRTLRRAKGLTVQALAELADMSVGLLSQLERGKGNPSFHTLVRLSYALRVPAAELFAYEPARSPVVRREQRPVLSVHGALEEDGSVAELLTPAGTHAFEVMALTMPPGYSSEATPLAHEGEEFGIVLSGIHEVHLGDSCYELREGDSITYSSRIPHWYRNRGMETVRAMWVIAPSLNGSGHSGSLPSAPIIERRT